MLSARDLACSRGERMLFAHMNLSVGPRDWLQVTGPNGSGKTTLLRTLVGLSAAAHGDIFWNGTPVRKQMDAFRRAVLYLGHPSAMKDELTPLENLRLAGALEGHGVADSDAASALETMGLRGRVNLSTRFLSAGQKRRVLLARLLVRPAALWVLDEPFAALDAAAVDLVGELLQAHLERGGMAVLTSHQPVPLLHGSVVAL